MTLCVTNDGNPLGVRVNLRPLDDPDLSSVEPVFSWGHGYAAWAPDSDRVVVARPTGAKTHWGVVVDGLCSTGWWAENPNISTLNLSNGIDGGAVPGGAAPLELLEQIYLGVSPSGTKM